MEFKDLNLLSIGNTIQMIGAVYQGEGKTFVTIFPGEDIDNAIHELHMSSAEWEIFIRQTDLLEVEQISKSPDGSVVKAIVRKSQRQIEQGVSWRVFKRDGYRCQYCYGDDVPLTVDHLITWESGGPSIESNLLSACRRCNRTRGDISYEAWLNHQYYRKVSQNLPPEVRAKNEALVETLSFIPRSTKVRSR